MSTTGPAGAAPGLDSQAALAPHIAKTQAGADGDVAIIKRIEGAMANSAMGRLQALLGSVGSKASSEQGAISGKVAEHNDQVAKNSKDAPPDAGAPPRLGPATTPAVKTTGGDAGKAAAAPQKAAGGPSGKEGGDKKIAGKGGKGAGAAKPHVESPADAAANFSGAGNDAQLGAMLNAYAPKSAEPTEMVGRIKQMKSIADGFNGQLDVYVAQGGAVEQAIAGAANFLGVGKDTSAIWATNPYREMHGVLGGIMTGISAVKQVAGVVGSICGKLGLLLTVIGLLGMIFPPIGVAVSGIARILNAVGLICDVISFVLSAILTGLNGVHLAQQIAAGASAEEKAATADLMISEANGAAGGLISLAMQFGPKFMKGLMSNSRGVLNSLIRRFKAVVQRVTLKLSGNVKSIANRMLKKIGLGGPGQNIRVDGAWKANGMLARGRNALNNSGVGKVVNSGGAAIAKGAKAVYRSPAKAVEYLNAKAMKNFGNSAFAKRLDRVGAWAGTTADRFDLEKRVGDSVENLGKKAANNLAATPLARKWANAADASETETRKAAMEAAQKDAMRTEEERWRSYMTDRAAQQQRSGTSSLSESGRDKFVGGRVNAVRDKHQADFDAAEVGQTRQARDAAERAQRTEANATKQASSDYHANGTNQQGQSHRDQYMDEVHRSREKRWKLETTLEDKDKQRKRLLEMEKRSADQEAELTRLNAQLSMLDRARVDNQRLEKNLSTLSGHTQVEVHTLSDLHQNVDGSISSALEMLHLKNERSAWRATEKEGLRKQTKWNAGAASAGAASRAGSGTYAEIKAAQQTRERADFAAFVAKGRPSLSVAQTARSMLSSVKRTPPVGAPAPDMQPQEQTQTPATATTPAPSTPSVVAPVVTSAATSTVTSAVTNGGGNTAGGAGDGAAAAKATGLPDPVAEPEEAGGEDTLPYWPDIVTEFDKGMSDFGYMRRVATEFKKAQVTGKQKAVDTLHVYGQYEEYSAKRAEHAKKHQGDAQGTQKDAQGNATNAGGSQEQGNRGASKEEEARGAANNRAAVDLPEPETRGFWGKIIGQIKRWAKAKAGELFGFIQEQIASAVMGLLCGVTMADMRDYAGALRRQQMAASGVAGTAATTAGQAQQEQIKLGGNAQKEAQSAADAIGECDTNIVEADKFIADVTAFEGQLTQEKHHAQAFIGQVYAMFHAEQARKKAEQEAAARQQEAEDAAAAAQAAQEQAADQSVDPTPGGEDQSAPPADDLPTMSVAPALDPGTEPAGAEPADHLAEERDAEMARVQIHSTTDYIKASGEQMHVQVQGRADDYANQLKLALTNRTGDSSSGQDLVAPAKRQSASILEDFKTFIESTKREMDTVNNVTIDPSSAGRIADQVIATAESLDTHYAESMSALDNLFESTYRGIRDGERTWQNRLLDGDNAVGQFNHDAMDTQDQVLDTHAAPVVNAAWKWASTPIQQAPAAGTPAPAPATTTTPSP